MLFLDEAHAARGRAGRAETADTAAGDPAFMLYTSGTTKDPKGVTHTHGYCFTKRAAGRALARRPPGRPRLVHRRDRLGEVDLERAARALEPRLGDRPPRGRLRRGGALRAARAARGHGALPGADRVPAEAKLDELGRYDLSRVRHLVSAGEPLNPEVIRAFRDAFGLTIHDGYGQTENTLLAGNFPGMEIRPGSMGLAAPGHEVAVIGEDGWSFRRGGGRRRAAGPSADALHRLLGRARGDRSGLPRRLVRDGRPGVRDEDGYFWFAGRADDVILSAAYRIGPFEVESALLEHEAVAESAVVGKPDAERGQIVKAFVVLRPGHEAGASARPGAAGAREARDRAVQVPARDRVRRRAAEDAQRQDPPSRAARARARAGRRQRLDSRACSISGTSATTA